MSVFSDKIKKMLENERDQAHKLIMAPYQKGVNYVQTMDDRAYYCDCLHYMALNRSFINLNLVVRS